MTYLQLSAVFLAVAALAAVALCVGARRTRTSAPSRSPRSLSSC